MRRPIGLATLLIVAACAFSQTARAQPGTCAVPGTHPTLQAAVDDPSCTSIALAAGTYAEAVEIHRSLTVAGPAAGGAVLAGPLRVAGGTTTVELRDLRIASSCPQAALEGASGAQVDAYDVEVVAAAGPPCPAPIFADGFESGDTSAWSAAVP